MRVAYVSTYPPIECGIGTYTQYLSDALRRHHKEVHVISQHGARGRNVHHAYDPGSRTIAQDIFAVAARISPDVVHVEHEFGLFGDQYGVQVVELVLRLKMAGIPCLATLHTVNQKRHREESIVLENLVRNCERVIVHEEYQKEILERDFGAANARVIPHGVRRVDPVPDAKKIVGVEGKKVILLAGFFRKTKNFDRVVDLFPRVLKRVPEACLLVAGKLRGIEQSDYQVSFLRRLNESPARDHTLILRGQFPQYTFDTILCSAEIMAFPYVMGAQSGVMAHSAAFGIPVVTSNLRSFRLWVEKTGGGVWADSDDEFTEAMIRLLTDGAFREECRRNLRRAIQPLLWENVSLDHIRLYEEVIRVPYGKARYFYVPEPSPGATPAPLR